MSNPTYDRRCRANAAIVAAEHAAMRRQIAELRAQVKVATDRARAAELRAQAALKSAGNRARVRATTQRQEHEA